MVLMRGATLVREGIANYLASAVPTFHELAVTQWGLTVNDDFPLPTRYDAYEPLGFSSNTGPLVGIAIGRTRGFSVVDVDPTSSEEYRPIYSVRVFVWCYTQMDSMGNVPPAARARTLRLRDDLGALVRSAILDRPSLGQPDAFDMIHSTITEDYFDGVLTPNVSGRWVAGMAIAFDLRVDESGYREPIGTVEVPVMVEATLFDAGEDV